MPKIEAHWENLVDAHACPLPHCTNWVDELPAENAWGPRGHIALSAVGGTHSHRSICNACGSKHDYGLFWSLHELHRLRREFGAHHGKIIHDAGALMDGGPQAHDYVSRERIEAAKAYLTGQLP